MHHNILKNNIIKINCVVQNKCSFLPGFEKFVAGRHFNSIKLTAFFNKRYFQDIHLGYICERVQQKEGKRKLQVVIRKLG